MCTFLFTLFFFTRLSSKFSIFYFIFSIKPAGLFFFLKNGLNSIQVLLHKTIQLLLLLLLLYARIWLILKGHHQVQLLSTTWSQTVYIYTYFPFFWPAHWVGSFVQLSCTCCRNQRRRGKNSFKTLCIGSSPYRLFKFIVVPIVSKDLLLSRSASQTSWSSVWCPLLYSLYSLYSQRASRILCLKDTSYRNASKIRQKQQRPAARSLSYFSVSIGQQACTTKKPKY